MKKYVYYLSIFIFIMSGCTSSTHQTVKQSKKVPAPSQETHQEITEALGSVAQAVTGKEMDKKDVRKLIKSINKDEEAKASVQVITETLTNTGPRAKYCPVCGRHYSPRLEMCPKDKVFLKEIID